MLHPSATESLFTLEKVKCRHNMIFGQFEFPSVPSSNTCSSKLTIPRSSSLLNIACPHHLDSCFLSPLYLPTLWPKEQCWSHFCPIKFDLERHKHSTVTKDHSVRATLNPPCPKSVNDIRINFPTVLDDTLQCFISSTKEAFIKLI